MVLVDRKTDGFHGEICPEWKKDKQKQFSTSQQSQKAVPVLDLSVHISKIIDVLGEIGSQDPLALQVYFPAPSDLQVYLPAPLDLWVYLPAPLDL